MADITARELGRDTGAALRRAERGERLRVTVSGRPVAELVPLPRRPGFLPLDTLLQDRERWLADPGLAADLRELLREAADELPGGPARS